MKRLRWYDFIFINLFWIGLNIRNNAVGIVFQPFLVDKYAPGDWKNTALSIMGNAGLIIAMLVQPAIGLISDRSTSRFGRRRPFILVGALLDLVFLVAIGLSNSYWSLFAAIMLIQFSANISHGALQGLIPDMVPEDQRGRASAIKSIFELLPIAVVVYIIAHMVEAGKLNLAIVVTGAGLLIAALVTIFFVKEQPLKEKPDTPFWPPMIRVLGMLAGIILGAVAGLVGGGLIGGIAGLISWPIAGKESVIPIVVGVGGIIAMVLAIVIGVWAGARMTIGKEASQHTSFIWWIVNRLLFLAAITSLRSFALYFFEYSFKISAEQATGFVGNLTLMVGIFLILSAIPAGWLADKIGKKMLIGISGIIGAVGGFLLLGTIAVPNPTLIYISGGILGVATGMFMTTNWALGTNLVPPEEAGRYLGISNLAGAGAAFIGYGIGAPVADYLNKITPGVGYIATFAAYGVLFLLSTVSLRFIREPKLSISAAVAEQPI
jgi:MFS family permease